jgi:hypothetical protein
VLAPAELRQEVLRGAERLRADLAKKPAKARA